MKHLRERVDLIIVILSILSFTQFPSTAAESLVQGGKYIQKREAREDQREIKITNGDTLQSSIGVLSAKIETRMDRLRNHSKELMSQSMQELLDTITGKGGDQGTSLERVKRNVSEHMEEVAEEMFELVNTTIASMDLLRYYYSTTAKLDAMMDATLDVVAGGESPGQVAARTGQENKHRGFLDSLLKSPMAQLYKGASFTGAVTLYDYENSDYHERGCYDSTVWGSAKPLKSCIRLFQDSYCTGPSLAIYPGSIHQTNVLAKLTRVYSIGPCLSHEFDFSSVSGRANKLVVAKDVSRVEEIPDLVDMTGAGFYGNATSVSSNENSVTKYSFDVGRRVKMLEAIVRERHLGSGSSSPPGTIMYPALVGKGEPCLGFVIPPTLGGPRNETYNKFDQSRSNAKEWEYQTERIRTIISTFHGQLAYIRITFSYENQTSTRPFGFYYYIRYEFRFKISYGFIRN